MGPLYDFDLKVVTSLYFNYGTLESYLTQDESHFEPELDKATPFLTDKAKIP